MGVWLGECPLHEITRLLAEHHIPGEGQGREKLSISIKLASLIPPGLEVPSCLSRAGPGRPATAWEQICPASSSYPTALQQEGSKPEDWIWLIFSNLVPVQGRNNKCCCGQTINVVLTSLRTLKWNKLRHHWKHLTTFFGDQNMSQFCLPDQDQEDRLKVKKKSLHSHLPKMC